MKRLVVKTLWGSAPLVDALECGHTHHHRTRYGDECRYRMCWQCRREKDMLS